MESTALHRISICADRDSLETLQMEDASLDHPSDKDVSIREGDKKAPLPEVKHSIRSRSNSNDAKGLNIKPLFVQIGFGIDHDGSNTAASIRAFRGAVERGGGAPSSCLSKNEAKEGEKIATIVELGVPNPASVNLSEVSSSMKALSVSCTFLGGGAAPAEMNILKPIHVVAGGLQSSSFPSSGLACDSTSSSSGPKTCCAVAMITTVLLQENDSCLQNSCGTKEPLSPKKDSEVIAELSHDLESKNEEIRLLQEVTRLRIAQMKQKYESLEEEHEQMVCEKIHELDLLRKRLQLRDEVVKTLTEDCNGLQEALRAKLDGEEQEDEESPMEIFDRGEEVGMMFEKHEKNIEMIAQEKHERITSQASVQIPTQAERIASQKAQVEIPAQFTLAQANTEPSSSPDTVQKINKLRPNDGKSIPMCADVTEASPTRHALQSCRNKKQKSKKNALASSLKKKSANKGPKSLNDKGPYQPNLKKSLKSAKTNAVKHIMRNQHLPTKRNKLHLHLSVPKSKCPPSPATPVLEMDGENNSNKTVDADATADKKHCLPSALASPKLKGFGFNSFVPDTPKISDGNSLTNATTYAAIDNPPPPIPIAPINLQPPAVKVHKKLVSSTSSKSSDTVFEEKNALTYEDHSVELPTAKEQAKLRSVVAMKNTMKINVKNYRNGLEATAAAEVAPGGYSEKGCVEDSNNDSTSSSRVPPSSNIDKSLSCAHWFPLKLHIALDLIEAEGHSDIISWQPHGRAILIHDQLRFIKTVMPIYFKQTKISSFQRQLNLYGFQRIVGKSEDKGAYWHEKFLRGMPHLCLRMKRHRVKGNKVRAPSNPTLEPRFNMMKPLRYNTSTPQPSTLSPSTPSVPSSSNRLEVDLMLY